MSTVTFPFQQVGDFTVTAISDGYLTASLDFLSNIDTAEASRMQRDAGQQEPSAIHINCYVIRGAGRTILVDAGAGGIRQWGGRLIPNLLLAGIDPAVIDTILLTHAHPDHVGGLMNAAGHVTFPQAELVVHRREVGFWQDDANLSRASERARGNFLIARQVFDGYRDRLRMFDEGEVLPGIRAMPLPGHTDGHTGYVVESGDRGLLVWGVYRAFPAHPDQAARRVDRLRSGRDRGRHHTIAAAGPGQRGGVADRRHAFGRSGVRTRHANERGIRPA